MAEYKFACKNCGASFTVSHPMIDSHPALINCPYCLSMEVLRVWTPVPIHYKGSGFYTTDVASEKEFE